MISLRISSYRAGSQTAFKSFSLPIRTYATKPPTIINGTTYPSDSQTNVSPTILSKLPLSLHTQPNHPLSIIRRLIESHFLHHPAAPSFVPLIPGSPIVSVAQNFDELGFPLDHPGRAKSDSYYLNKHTVLRTHTSAHEIESFRKGLERYLISADVYRRDEIDASHYPVFHQMEGASVWTAQQLAELPALNARLRDHIASSPSPLILIDNTHPPDPETNPSQPEHDVETRDLIVENLKLSLNSLILTLFRSHTDQKGEPLQVKWIPATFPWTAPSYEVEVLYEGKWLEILGSGVVKQDTLQRADCSDKMGWAFGLGLERLAMILFSIPDIRLFWSTDPRFLSQFSDPSTSPSPSSSHTPDVPKTAQSSHTSSDVQSSQKRASVPESTEHARLPVLRKFVPFSRYPECKKDVSFWLPTEDGAEWHENDFCDGVRDVAGDVVEGVRLLDEFTHPKTGRRSMAYRINYQSMDRNLTNEEANALHGKVHDLLRERFGAEIR